MSGILKIGNLSLSMGNVSHVISLPKTSLDFDKYLRYSAYQSKFN